MVLTPAVAEPTPPPSLLPAIVPDNPPPLVAVAPVVWPAWQRFAFRYLLCHFALYALPRPFATFLSTVAYWWRELGGALELDLKERPWRWPTKWSMELNDVNFWWRDATSWLSEKGLSPYEVIHQQTGSGDTGHAFTRLAVIVLAALVLATVWTLCSRAVAYPRLGRWLHLFVRFELAITMLSYGLGKFYTGQFGELHFERLTQEIGDTRPMAMVGTFMKASRPYELFGGAGEVIGGLLLFHHRTALLGACITAAVMANVCALNWFHGVPVKLSSTHLLVFAILLLLPYRDRLWALFVSNRTSTPVDIRVVKSTWLRWSLFALGVAWVGGHLAMNHVQRWPSVENQRKGMATSELFGAWQVESMQLDGQELPATDTARWRYFGVERGRSAWARDMTGAVTRYDFEFDLPTWSARVRPMQAKPATEPMTWRFEVGTKTVPVEVELMLRIPDRWRKIDGERRTLLITGTLGGRQLEVRAVEKRFHLQTPFRLRQELPDFW